LEKYLKDEILNEYYDFNQDTEKYSLKKNFNYKLSQKALNRIKLNGLKKTIKSFIKEYDLIKNGYVFDTKTNNFSTFDEIIKKFSDYCPFCGPFSVESINLPLLNDKEENDLFIIQESPEKASEIFSKYNMNEIKEDEKNENDDNIDNIILEMKNNKL
jgi:glutathionyl-hydroquinone reductase